MNTEKIVGLIIFIMMIVGCSPTQESVSKSQSDTVYLAVAKQFPDHYEQPEITGPLNVENGCIVLGQGEDATLVVVTPDISLHVISEQIELHDADENVVGIVGEEFSSGGNTASLHYTPLEEPVPDRCVFNHVILLHNFSPLKND